MAEALGVHPSTVRRAIEQFSESGLDCLDEEKRGPKKPFIMGPLLPAIQAGLDQGASIRSLAKEVGCSEANIRYTIKKGMLVRREVPAAASANATQEVRSPTERVIEDQQASEAGVAVKRGLDRTLAAVGMLGEAAPQFEAAEAVPGAGVLLAVPWLLKEGLIEVGTAVYTKLPQGFYGLRSILLLLAFMALLRIRNPEQLETRSPGELGRLLGLDRSPDMKTLRKKMKALSDEKKAGELVNGLAKKWVAEDPWWSMVLYVDGHVRVYEGRKHALLKTYAPRRKQCQQGEKEYFVNDQVGNPLFFVLSPTNEGLVKVLDEKILPDVRRLVGKEARPLLIFDREGWSPESFESWYKKGFDILTYRKGEYEDWPLEEFQETPLRRKKQTGVEPEYYRMATRVLQLRAPVKSDPNDKGFSVLEIRFLDDGHQVSCVTTAPGEPHELVKSLKGRWKQENFFRYMREEFAMDHVITQAMELEDPEKLVSNPVRLKKEGLLEVARRSLGVLEQEIGIRAMTELEGKPSKKRGRPKDPDDKVLKEAAVLRRRITKLEKELSGIPKKVPRKDLHPVEEIVRRESERKLLSGAIKMVAYRAETWLYRFLKCFGPNWKDRDRAFIKNMFQLPGDILPDEKAQTLTIRLHPPSTWRWKSGLTYICELATQRETKYPGTDLRLIYQVLDAN